MHELSSWVTRLPSLDALRVFHVAAQCLSFSKAARSLHVTQGAVSHRIRGLEAALQTSLFDRGGRSVRLTHAGRVLKRATDQAFEVLDGSISELRSLDPSGTLMVSCSPSFAMRWLVPHLPLLQAAAPDLDVRIAASDRLETPGVHGIDVCIRYGPGSVSSSSVSSSIDELRLSVESVTPVCSPQLLQGRHPLTTVDDLQHHVLLHDDVLAELPGRVGWTRWLEIAGASLVDPDRGLRFSHAHLAVEAALAGQGVALARGILVARELAEGRLVAPFSCSVESGLAYWLLTARRDRGRPQVQAFRRWLLQAVSPAGPSGAAG